MSKNPQSGLVWNCPFVLPFWLQTVWHRLGGRTAPYILSVHDGADILGVVPLAVDGQSAGFLGTADVCDYQDIVSVPGQEAAVMAAVVDHLSVQGIERLDLKTLHPDAAVLRGIRALEANNIRHLTIEPDEVTYEAPLPAGWDDYLMQLNGKQRHEVRRKLRRLQTQGAFAYRMAEPHEIPDVATEQFLRLFQLNRKDKAEFMSAGMAAYFRDLIAALADHKLLRLYFLDVENDPAATVLCFDHAQVRYLYNSGYDAHYHDLSVGILSKLLSIQAGIECGCRRYDFLKGAEIYKKRIGGQEVPLYQCKILL